MTMTNFVILASVLAVSATFESAITKHVDKQVRSIVRILAEEVNPCEPNLQDVLSYAPCEAFFKEVQAMNQSSGTPAATNDTETQLQATIDMVNRICKHGKCLGKISEMTATSQKTDACKAQVLKDSNSCKNMTFPVCGSECKANNITSTCYYEAEYSDFTVPFQSLCAKKDDGTTCFEAVFKPYLSVFTALKNNSSGPIVLNEECGAVPIFADNATQRKFQCCTLESYGCCYPAMKAMAGGFSEEEDSVKDVCPSLAKTAACPNPFRETTYLKFNMPVACLTDPKDLVVLEELLVPAWGLDAGSIELSLGGAGNVGVTITVPQDKKATDVESKIKAQKLELSKLGSSCISPDPSTLSLTQKVSQPGDGFTTSTAPAIMVGSLTALFVLF